MQIQMIKKFTMLYILLMSGFIITSIHDVYKMVKIY